MKTLIFAALAASVFLMTGPAWATYEVTNRIRSIDPAKHEVRLRDGLYYEFLPNVSLAGYKVGDMVTIIVHQYNDNMGLQCHAEAIERAPEPPR